MTVSVGTATPTSAAAPVEARIALMERATSARSEWRSEKSTSSYQPSAAMFPARAANRAILPLMGDPGRARCG